MPNNTTVGTASIGLRVNSRQFEEGLIRANNKWTRFLDRLSGNGFGTRINDRLARIQERFMRQIGQRMRPVFDRIDQWFDMGGFDALLKRISGLGLSFAKIAPQLGLAVATIGVFAMDIGSIILEFKVLSNLIPALYNKLKPLIELGVSFVKSTAQLGASMQQVKQSFKTLVGDFEGNELVEWIQNFADVTPFNFEGLTNSTRQMIQFGFSVEQSKKALQLIGDTVAATTGKMENVDRIAYVMGRTLALNRVYTRNVQMLINDGFRGWDALAEHLGKSVEEVMQMTHRGQIDGVTALNAWFNYMQRYSGGMDKLSKTMSGMLSTVEDEWEQFKRSFGTEVTAPALEKILPYAIAAIRWLQQQLPRIAKLASHFLPIIGKHLLNVAGYIYTVTKHIAKVIFGTTDFAKIISKVISVFIKWHNVNANIINSFYRMWQLFKGIFGVSKSILDIWIAINKWRMGDSKGASDAYQKAKDDYQNAIQEFRNMGQPLIPFFNPDADYTQEFRNSTWWRDIQQLVNDFINQHIDIFGDLHFGARGDEAGTEFMEGLQSALESRKSALQSTMDYMKDTVTAVIDKLKSNYQSLGRTLDEVNKKFDVFRQVGVESYAILGYGQAKAGVTENEFMNNQSNIAEAYRQVLSERQQENSMYANIGSYLFGRQYANTNYELENISATLGYIKNILSDNSSNTAINQIPIEGYDDMIYSGGF